MEPVAVYLRMSSDDQDLSLGQQEREVRKLCERKGYSVVSVYKDEGISGDNFKRRKGLQSMLADASSGKFVRVVAWDQDRIGRHDSLRSGVILEPLRQNGIAIETVAQGEIDLETFGGRITFAALAEAKHQFLKDLSRNVVRGQIDKAESANGAHGGPPLFGYRREVFIDDRGKPLSRYVVIEREAEIVRLAFAEYLKPDSSVSKVADLLTATGVPAPRTGKHWEPHTIRYMLKNPGYTGRLAYGRKPSGSYHRGGASGITPVRGPRLSRRPEPIVKEAAHIIPRLVDDETFNRVQELLARRRLTGTRKRGTIRPLSGLIVCGKCGRRFHCDGPSYLCSSSKLRDPNRCSGHRLREDDLLDRIQAEIDKALANPAAVGLLRKKIEERLARADTGNRGDKASQGRRLQELEQRLRDGAARLLEVPAGLVPELSKALEEVRRERDALAGRVADERKRQKPSEVSDRVVSRLVKEARSLRNARKAGAAAVNDALHRMGTEVLVRQNDRKGVVLDVRVGSVGDSGRSGGRTPQATARRSPAVLEFRLVLPPPRRPGFQKGNSAGVRFGSEERARRGLAS